MPKLAVVQHTVQHFVSQRVFDKNHGWLHFVVFFHVVSQFFTWVDNEKEGGDNEKALELDNLAA